MENANVSWESGAENSERIVRRTGGQSASANRGAAQPAAAAFARSCAATATYR